MPRPCKYRRVSFLPNVTYFKPAGIPVRLLEEVRLTLDELEAIRLKDMEGLEQEQGAEKMNVSRPTFQRILASARRKTADVLLNGKALRIEGGPFEVSGALEETATQTESKSDGWRNKTLNIAVVTDDGITICQHFGRARYYAVVTIEDRKVESTEQRPKAGHHVAGMQHTTQASQGERHGFDANAQTSHASMIANITDCQLVIAGGMGWGAQESLKQAGIAVHMTDVENIEEAVKLYLQGKLANRAERLH